MMEWCLCLNHCVNLHIHQGVMLALLLIRAVRATCWRAIWPGSEHQSAHMSKFPCQKFITIFLLTLTTFAKSSIFQSLEKKTLGISFSKNLPTQEVTVFKLHPIYLLSESVVSFKPKIHLGLTELTKAPLWSAPIQRLIKAAFNEGSLIDTAGLASPLAGINDGSHMMRLMTGSQAGGWQDVSARPPPRLIVARFCARVTQQDSPSFDFWASVECFHDEKTHTEFLGCCSGLNRELGLEISICSVFR